MMNRDPRIERTLHDAKFATLVRSYLTMFYSDAKITYSDACDALYVARLKYEIENPSIPLIGYGDNTILGKRVRDE